MIGSNRRIVTTGHALYVCPHQDDEQLAFGAAIRADLEAGRTVDVLLVTDGRWAGARTYQTMIDRIGYTATPEEFSVQRDKEFIESCRRMGALPIVPPITERIEDGHGTIQATRTLIEKYGKPGSLLRGTTNYDYHLDHRSIGFALIELEEEGFGTDLMLMQSAWSVNNGFGPPSGRQVIERPPFSLVYQWPYRRVDVSKGWWGIGYLDVPEHFDYISGSDPHTYWHEHVEEPEPISYSFSGAQGTNKSSSSSFTVSSVPYIAGGLTLAWIVTDNSSSTNPVVNSIGRPSGETSTWQLVHKNNSPNATSGAGVVTQLYALKPTVTQTTNTTITLSGSVTAKVANFATIDAGVPLNVILASGATGASGTLYVSGEEGDLIIGALGKETTGSPVPDVRRGGVTISRQLTLGAATTGSSSATNAGCALHIFGDTEQGLSADTSADMPFSGNTDGGAVIAVIRPA